MFSAIHHVALIVSDYQKAKHFYVDILGFEILTRKPPERQQRYKARS